ncbi:hypothetical protein ACFL0R_00415 [Pseudomonadota bacterium]
MRTHPYNTNNLITRAMQLLVTIALASLIPLASHAGAPDGKTPAQEGVCDPLKADGVTKGLHGLCVAFCEAQDFASVDMPLTDEEISAFEDSRPSANLLKNYNRKKKETDPAMPCIVRQVNADCPCWSADEFEQIDGTNNDQPSNQLSFACNASSTTTGMTAVIYESTSSSQKNALAYGFARENITTRGVYRSCVYNDKYNGTNTFRFSTNLSEGDFSACYEAIATKCP